MRKYLGVVCLVSAIGIAAEAVYAQQAPAPTNQVEQDSRIGMLQQQRNSALDTIVIYAGQVAVLQDQLAKEKARADAAEARLKAQPAKP